jgi:hypothetical protein
MAGTTTRKSKSPGEESYTAIISSQMTNNKKGIAISPAKPPGIFDAANQKS